MNCLYCGQILFELSAVWSTANVKDLENNCLCPLQRYKLFNDEIIFYHVTLSCDLDHCFIQKELLNDETISTLPNLEVLANKSTKTTTLNYSYTFEEFAYEADRLANVPRSRSHCKYIALPNPPSLPDFLKIIKRIEKLETFK